MKSRTVRRSVLRAVAVAMATAMLRPLQLLAGGWNKAAFDARAVADALKGIGVTATEDSDRIVLKAPEIAENGAIVPLEIASQIPGTEAIYILVDKNPQPLTAVFEFANGAEAFVATRIKMNESSRVRILARAGGKFYATMREVKVTIGGCGA
ncbi:MAG TPA: thiosulfate oxidation carrier protein SoxY [Burkholderiales bacterium]|jgi:sulfur-oxidizing protein SoxY|nr:thiosulfate oxidation carrier protein SoxY [Burkholderiales bacterium]